MIVYADLVLLLNFAVDFLLLLGTSRLTGYGIRWKRAAGAAVFGGVYAAACVLAPFRFLTGVFWRFVSLGIMSVVAFGWNRGTVRRGVLFVFLSMALGGISLGLNRGGFWALTASAAVVCVMCFLGFQGLSAEYVSVELRHQGRSWKLTALRDTGNTLRDPVTGQQVVVAGSDIAWEILGLTEAQLRCPIETMKSQSKPGMRLIPYRSVGQPCGMLLAVQLDEVLIGGQKSGRLVAFAPQILDREEAYQVLAGGMT